MAGSGLFSPPSATTPLHAFKALCQNEACHAFVGYLHIPCTSGVVVFICYKCNTASRFENKPEGFETRVLGKVTASKS